MDGTTEPNPPSPELSDDEALLESLPKEVGFFLVIIGVGGILVPGPIGAPLVILGGVVLFPKVFRGADKAMRERFPEFHKQGIKQVRRFAGDLERRYPDPRRPLFSQSVYPGATESTRLS